MKIILTIYSCIDLQVSKFLYMLNVLKHFKCFVVQAQDNVFHDKTT